MALAVDVASSHFCHDSFYHLDGEILDGPSMIGRLSDWVERYPIVSIEDGLAEEDWESWPHLNAAIGDRALVLGDDFLCTNASRIRRAVEKNCANALLLKVNQVGTLSEAAEACRLARAANWRITVSAAVVKPRIPGCRPRGGLVGRPDQDRLHHTVGTPSQIQSTPGDRNRRGLAHGCVAR